VVKKTIYAALSLILALLPLAGLEKTKNIAMSGSTLKLTVIYPKEWVKAADFYLGKAAGFLPALEKYVGYPFPGQSIEIYLEPALSHAYQMDTRMATPCSRRNRLPRGR
jgi:hypothetical protein